MRQLAKNVLTVLHGYGSGVGQPAVRSVQQVEAAIAEAKSVREKLLWTWAGRQARRSNYTQQEWKAHWRDHIFTEEEVDEALQQWTQDFAASGSMKEETKERIRALEARDARRDMLRQLSPANRSAHHIDMARLLESFDGIQVWPDGARMFSSTSAGEN